MHEFHLKIFNEGLNIKNFCYKIDRKLNYKRNDLLKYKQFKQGESYRHTRVKMHKSGKHWVRTIMSKVGTIRLGSGLTKSFEQSAKVSDSNEFRKSTISTETVLKGASAIGVLLGGVALGTDEAFAEETVIASETSSTQTIVAEEAIILSTEATVSETSNSNIIDLLRASERSEAEASISASQSVESSISESISQSLSESYSLSLSTSISASESLSESVSESLSNSESASESASILKKDSQSETSSSSSNSEKESNETESAVDEKVLKESRENLTSVTSGAEVLIKIATEQSFDVSDADLAAALVTTQAEIASATALLGDTTANLSDIQATITSIRNSSQALAAELLKQTPDGKLSYKMETTSGSQTTFDISDFTDGGDTVLLVRW